MKLVNILFACMLTTSCSQNIDLESLRNDGNISEIVKENKNLVRDRDVTYGLLSYRTIDLKNFNFGSVYFSKYKFPNSYDADYNDLSIHIDDYKNNNFLGFTIEIVNQEESKKLLEYLTNKYGKPESHYAGNHDKAFVWYNNKPTPFPPEEHRSHNESVTHPEIYF